MGDNRLQQHLLRCYLMCSLPKGAPTSVLKGLSNKTLILSDLEIHSDDLYPLCRFLNSKLALNQVESLILNRTSESSKRSRRIALLKGGTYSGLNLEGSRMLKAVHDFIARSSALQILEIDGIHYSHQLLVSLGSAITNHHLGLRHLSFRGIPMGNDGLRLLTPHISQSRVQCLRIEDCGLTDSSLPFITSIMKSQEAMQDKHFWNSTLRVYPDEDGVPAKSRVMVYEGDSTDNNHGLVTLNLSRNKLGNKGALKLCDVMRQNQWILGLNLSDNQIEERGVYHLLRELVSPEDQQCALISLHLRGNPGCDARAEEMLTDMNKITSGSPLFASLRPDVAAVLHQWSNVRKYSTNKKPRSRGTSAQKSTQPAASAQVLYDDDGDDGALVDAGDVNGAYGGYVGGRAWDDNVVDVTTDAVADVYLADDAGDAEDENDPHVDCNGGDDENDGVLKQTRETGRAVDDCDYLKEFPFDDLSPEHPVDGMLDGRPPSRIGLRPRVSAESSPDEKRPESRMGIRQQHNHHGNRYYETTNIGRRGNGNGSRVTAGKRELFSGGTDVRYTSPYEEEKRISPAAYEPQTHRQPRQQTVRRSRSSDHEFRQLPSSARDSHMKRSRSADGHAKAPVPARDRYSPGEFSYMHTTVSFDSYRRKARECFDETRRSLLNAPVPFVPTSGHADSSSPSKKPRPASAPRARNSYDLARMRMARAAAVDQHVSKEEELRIAHDDAGCRRASSHTRAGRRERTSRRRRSGSSEGRAAATWNGRTAPALTAARRKSTTIGRRGTRSVRSVAATGTATVHARTSRRRSCAEQLVEEMGQSMMQELSKVVDIVSSDLRTVSQQLKVLSTSMTESMITNASRENSRTYGDIRITQSGGFYDDSDVIGYHDDKLTSPQQHTSATLAARSPSTAKAGTRYSEVSAKHLPLSPPAMNGHPTRGKQQSQPMQLQLSSDSDRILTEMIQEGIRNKLIQLMRESTE